MNSGKASILISVSFLLIMALIMPRTGFGSTASSGAKPHANTDASISKTVTAAMFEHKEKKIFLIDVRRATEFQRYHIPGALNIALHAVKAKAFLKSKPVVLLNNGYEVGVLADTCRALRQNGYKAFVLAGGLYAWKAAGGSLTGESFARREMNLISASQFQRERAVEHQKIVHLTGSTTTKGAAMVPGAEVMLLSDREKAIARVRSWIKAKNANPFTRIVLMTATGKENHRIQRWLVDAGLHRQVFILKGGLKAYQKQLEFGVLARKSKRERKKSIGGCPTCPRE
jgi:rhodanese-related sulfurtransferase